MSLNWGCRWEHSTLDWTSDCMFLLWFLLRLQWSSPTLWKTCIMNLCGGEACRSMPKGSSALLATFFLFFFLNHLHSQKSDGPAKEQTGVCNFLSVHQPVCSFLRFNAGCWGQSQPSLGKRTEHQSITGSTHCSLPLHVQASIKLMCMLSL